jgi:BirA family transcriptional regulator, biotin operon repressor / biotin---[acetyl-CoA-carboxylase] ligase
LTGSTNADLIERAKAGAQEGTWLRSDVQQSGRGRLGRDWDSASGNVFASTILRLQTKDPAASGLALVAGVAVHRALSKLSPFEYIRLKWPNDILSLAGEKLCGMLLERHDDAVIIGIGVNLTSHPLALNRPVTSLVELGISPPSPQEFTEILAVDLQQLVTIWRNYGLAPILQDWQSRAHAVGTNLFNIMSDGEKISGKYDGLGADGALMLRLADGSVRAIHAGDVFLD